MKLFPSSIAVAPHKVDAINGPDCPSKAGAEGRKRPGTATFTLRDLLVATYAVPADTLRDQLPPGLSLDMLPSPEGERLGFIQTLCAFHENARWSVLPASAGQSFHQITYRILTRREGRRGAFVTRTYVSSDEGRAAQRALSRDADFARFSIYIAGDPARGAYESYSLRAQGDIGKTVIEARPRADQDALPFPFASLDELSRFFVDRPDNYFRASAPRAGVGVLRQEYGALTPPPTLLEWSAPPRLTLWSNLDLLPVENPAPPYSALIFPSITVTTSPPRFARLGALAPPPNEDTES